MTIGYLRVSTGKQHPANQKDEIRRFAAQKNISVDRWVVEVASGSVNRHERKLGRLLNTMHAGDTLIVTEISRLSRTLTEIMSIMGRCLDKGILLYTTKEGYTFDNTINSKVLCFAFGLVAEIERNLISMRTKEALAMRKAEGMKLGRRTGSYLYEDEYIAVSPCGGGVDAGEWGQYCGHLPAFRGVEGDFLQIPDRLSRSGGCRPEYIIFQEKEKTLKKRKICSLRPMFLSFLYSVSESMYNLARVLAGL